MLIGCPSKNECLLRNMEKVEFFCIRIVLNVVGNFESYYIIQLENECIPVFEMLGGRNLDAHPSLNSLYSKMFVKSYCISYDTYGKSQVDVVICSKYLFRRSGRSIRL